MIKQFLIVFVALIALNVHAQEGTVSPYSFYGIGELKFKGTVENKSMGGLSIYSDSIHLNLQNPASLSKLKLTTFTVGGNQKYTTLNSDTDSGKGSNTTLDYLAVGLPMGKISVSFGLMPYSAVGYKTGFNDPFAANNGDGRFEGRGGLNNVFLAAGYDFGKGFALGVNANYNFGKIEQDAYIIVDGDIDAYDIWEYNKSELSGFSITFGATYDKMLNDKLQLTSGITYTPGLSLTSTNQRELSTITWNVDRLPVVRNRETVDLAALGLNETNFKLPSKLSIGTGLGQPKKWFAGVEFTSLSTSNLANRTFRATNVSYKNASKFSLGGFYIPKFNSLTDYWKRIVYRAGMRFENTGLVVNNEDINEFGISFGAGFPVGRMFSNINLGMEYGTRGSTNAGLVKENFFNLNISLSFNDKWFQKRKID